MKAGLARVAWRLIVGGVFAYSAVVKLHAGAPGEGERMFAPPRTMYERAVYQQPARHYLLSGGELLLGLWMVSGLWNRGAAAATLLVLLVFSGAIGQEIWRRTPLACGCHVVEVLPGQDPAAVRRGLARSLGTNAILMTACLWLWRGQRRRGRVATGDESEPPGEARGGPTDR